MYTLLLLGVLAAPVDEPYFVLHTINPANAAEGLTVMDVNGDGLLDITCGQYWYEQPKAAWSMRKGERTKFNPQHLPRFVGNRRREGNAGVAEYEWKKHAFRLVAPDNPPDGQKFADGWFDNDYGEFLMDVNRDGKLDLISGGWFTKGIFWYENPGPGREGLWKAHRVSLSDTPDGDTEGLLFTDIDGDKRPDIVPQHYGQAGIYWYEFKDDNSVARHMVGKKGDEHGIGFGDIDGDGRGDIVLIAGWYKAPQDPRNGTWEWVQEEGFSASATLGHTSIPMLVYDVNADGKNDLIYGEGHDYGLFWHEQIVKDGKRAWKRHTIDDTWAQSHTLVLIDINGDGKLELVTGKRLYGHGGADPGAHEPQGIYYYSMDPATATFTKHVVAYNGPVGAGAQLACVDIDKDGDIDIVCPGQGGLYILENRGTRPR